MKAKRASRFGIPVVAKPEPNVNAKVTPSFHLPRRAAPRCTFALAELSCAALLQ
jgi:hypothetical protein